MSQKTYSMRSKNCKKKESEDFVWGHKKKKGTSSSNNSKKKTEDVISLVIDDANINNAGVSLRSMTLLPLLTSNSCLLAGDGDNTIVDLSNDATYEENEIFFTCPNSSNIVEREYSSKDDEHTQKKDDVDQNLEIDTSYSRTADPKDKDPMNCQHVSLPVQPQPIPPPQPENTSI